MSYHLTYTVTPHPEGIELDDIPKGHGACDAIIVVSIIESNGAVSRAYAGVDGRTGTRLNDGDEFASWVVWASKLAGVLPEGSWQRAIAYAAYEASRQHILGSDR